MNDKPTQSLSERLGRQAEWARYPKAVLPVFGPIPPVGDGMAASIDSDFREIKAGAPALQRIGLKWRSGAHWSYPYSYIGMIECQSPDRLIIRCNSPEVAYFEVIGLGLNYLIGPLSEHRVVLLSEADNPLFRRGKVMIKSIVMHAPEKPT